MFGAKKSYFRRIFDLRHFYGQYDNLYHPTSERPGKRLKTAKTAMAQKTGRVSQQARPVKCKKVVFIMQWQRYGYFLYSHP